jgi:hypothetical protein
MSWFWRGGEGPRQIPEWAYRYIVVHLKADPDRVSKLQCVEEPDYLGDRPVHLIRIFDPDAAQGAEIRDYASLDRYPELILYEGHRNPEGGEIAIFFMNEPAGS